MITNNENNTLFCSARIWLRGKIVATKTIFKLEDIENNARMIADYAHQNDINEVAYNQNLFVEYPYHGMQLAKQLKRKAPKTYIEFVVEEIPTGYSNADFPF